MLTANNKLQERLNDTLSPIGGCLITRQSTRSWSGSKLGVAARVYRDLAEEADATRRRLSSLCVIWYWTI
jgi:hypothetical protein